MTTRRLFRRLPVPLLGPLLLLASALATGIAAPQAWGQDDFSLDPVLFVHGYADNEGIWDTLIGLLDTQYGYPRQYLSAISLQPNPYNGSNVTAAQQIATAIQNLLTATGKTRVDLVSHSMGGLSTRWYITQMAGGAERVDTWISLAGANHGTSFELSQPGGFCNTPPTVAAKELCPAFIQAPGEVEDQVQLTLNGPGGFKNPNNNKDETPYGLGEDDPTRVGTNRVPPNATQRIFYATIRCQPAQEDGSEDGTIVPNDSTVVDGAGGRTITGPLPPGFAQTSPGNFQMPLTGTNCHETIHQNSDVADLVALLLRTNTLNFDTPAPEHGPGPLDGVFEGIDFGTGQWAWEGPFNVDPTNNIYFNSSSGTSRTFQFSPAPRVLTSMRVYSATTPGTLTLSDDRGQTHTQAVTTGSMQPVTTGWTVPSTTVTVSFTSGWDLGVDDITYR